MAAEDTSGDRIAKVLARAGVASRREAEKLIEAGRIAVNGRTIDSPALNVSPKDRITLDGQPVAAAEPSRMWLYYKPLGLVTSERDEKGRPTVFEALPDDMPRVMSVGRLDLNSEGLLLLTNDGEIKRRLELPSTGWLRKYRVRVNGIPTDTMLEPLRKGVTVDGERFQGMVVTIDRQQGANAWLTVGLREGRNREVRRAMEVVGLKVNRLIRVSYGPFKLAEMQPGDVQEIRAKVMRDQLGLEGTQKATSEDGPAPARGGPARKTPGGKGGPSKAAGPKPGGRTPAGGRAGGGKAGGPDAPRSAGAKAYAPRTGAGGGRSTDTGPAPRAHPGAHSGARTGAGGSGVGAPKPGGQKPGGPKAGGSRTGGPAAGGRGDRGPKPGGPRGKGGTSGR